MISPVCPLITHKEVSQAIEFYKSNQSADTLISSEETSMQVAKEDGNFININASGPLQPSQNNPKIHICNWAVTIWNGEIFKKNYFAHKGGYCGTNRIFFPLDPNKSVKVSYEQDFRMVESLLSVDKQRITNSSPSYWSPS
jgi:CMP-N-acetylneuraminic acid synthetase